MKRAILLFTVALALGAGCRATGTRVTGDAELAVLRLRLAPGLKAELFAAEPQLVNPVAFDIDEKGRLFVVETHRIGTSVYDIRNYMSWLDDDLSSRTTADREKMYRKQLGKGADALAVESERIRLIEDRDGDGRADHAVTFAEGFNTMLDGIASGVLARKGDVWFADIPNLWLLRDTNGDGAADVRKTLHTGYGVHMNYIGHDLHGLIFGPDGKLYFSIGDRGLHVETEGRTVSCPDSGAVLRCNPDGSGLELVHTGLRNPQELAFDQHGNLWTWDNNSDWHDMARWVQVVEGGDSGWRIGYQFLPGRGPWEDEKIWETGGDAPYRLPPLANIDHGPSGIAFYPGTGLPERYDNHFLLCNFPGGVNSWAVKPKGASYEVVDRGEFLWNVWATDVAFGPDGAVYVSDWGEGWAKKGVGRIYRVYDPSRIADPAVLEVKRLLAEGMETRPSDELAKLLGHRDMRVRQEAQFELVRRRDGKLLAGISSGEYSQPARLHAIWGLGQLLDKPAVLTLLQDRDPEIRAQAAKLTGEFGDGVEVASLMRLTKDTNLRVRFHATMALGKLKCKEALAPILEMLRENADGDAHLRHAGVMALVGIGDVEAIVTAGRHESVSVRLAALLALRRLERAEIAMFLEDKEPALVYEASRAINDAPIADALPALAALLDTNCPEKALARVINANFRLGKEKDLVAFAAKKEAPAAARVEALRALGNWEKPSGRDRVVGLWRPLDPRDADVAREALRPAVAGLLEDASNEVTIAVAQSVTALGMKDAAPALLKRAEKRELVAAVRAEALRALAGLKSDQLSAAVSALLDDPDETLRGEAIRLIPQAKMVNAAGHLEKLAAAGSVPMRQAAIAALGALEEKEADAVLARLSVKEIPAALRLDYAEAVARRSGRPLEDDLQASALLEGGDPKTGAALYWRPETGCVKCHKVRDGGGTVGPALTTAGARLKRIEILESIVAPNEKIAEGYEQLLVRTRGGDVKVGKVERETRDVLVLKDAEGRLEEIAQDDVAARKKGKSAMPEDYSKKLTKRELRDLVAYLAALTAADPKSKPIEPGAVVVDDEDPARFGVTGNWRTMTVGGDHGRLAHWSFPDASGRGKATWTATLPKAGQWRVYVWYGVDPLADHAPNAPYTVHHEGGEQTVRIDQTRETCAWKLLGSFPFGASKPARVVLSNDADKPVHADAVKFVPE